MKTQLFNIEKLPKLLFKYRDFNKESHLKLLLGGQLYMSSPRKFNDIYDCKIPIRFDLADEEYLKKEIRNVIQKVSNAPAEVKNHLVDIFVKLNILNPLRRYSTNDSFLSFFIVSITWCL